MVKVSLIFRYREDISDEIVAVRSFLIPLQNLFPFSEMAGFFLSGP